MTRTSTEDTVQVADRADAPFASQPLQAPQHDVVAETASASRPTKAYELTDEQRRRAYAWRVDGKWVVDSDDAALRRRVARALKKPLWVTEDVLAEDGCWWSTRVLLQPDDPRYAIEVSWRWEQIGLGDVEEEMVPLSDIPMLLAGPAGRRASR